MDVFFALAEPRRRKIVELLANNGQLSAGEIYRKFDITAQAVSQHLTILRKAGLLIMEKHAQRHIYKINSSSVAEIEEWSRHTLELWDRRFDALDRVLEEEKRKGAKKR